MHVVEQAATQKHELPADWPKPGTRPVEYGLKLSTAQSLQLLFSSDTIGQGKAVSSNNFERVQQIAISYSLTYSQLTGFNETARFKHETL